MKPHEPSVQAAVAWATVVVQGAEDARVKQPSSPATQVSRVVPEQIGPAAVQGASSEQLLAVDEEAVVVSDVSEAELDFDAECELVGVEDPVLAPVLLLGAEAEVTVDPVLAVDAMLAVDPVLTTELAPVVEAALAVELLFPELLAIIPPSTPVPGLAVDELPHASRVAAQAADARRYAERSAGRDWG